MISYPNIYTRDNASEVIKKLFSQCGPEDTNDLLWYDMINNELIMYMYSTYSVWRLFKVAPKSGQSPCTIVQCHGPNFGKIEKLRIFHFCIFS